MKRMLILIGLGFVVLTGSTILGAHLAQRDARERRAERFARSLIESILGGGERHGQALGAAELAEVERRGAAFVDGATLMQNQFRGDRWELAYCLTGGEGLMVWVPDPNPQRRARLLFEDADGISIDCDRP